MEKNKVIQLECNEVFGRTYLNLVPDYPTHKTHIICQDSSYVYLSERAARQLQSALNKLFPCERVEVKPKHGLLFVRHGDYYVYEIIGTNSEKCLVRWFENRNEQTVYYSIEEATKYLNNGDWNKIN